MPLKVQLGISKKIGLPNYGSLGASCHLELELDGALIHDSPNLQTRVRQVYAACSQAVHEELARQQTPSVAAANMPHGDNSVSHAANGAAHASPTQRASQRQVDYLQQLAGQIRGLGLQRLGVLLQQHFDKPLAELTAAEASGLIDALKAVKAGRAELETLFQGIDS